MEGGFVAHSGWRHPLLDVSRIRLQASRRCSASQDELDLDAAVVPFWHLCPGVQRMEMETVAGTIRREGPLQYQHLLHLPSYALSLVIPRAGEFARCGVLKKWDDVSFPKALGTVVTERAIDSLLVLLITALVFVMQIPVFLNFFEKTGTSMDSLLCQFTATGYIVTAICGIAVLILAHYLLKRLAIYNKVKATLGGLWQGIISLKGVRNVPLYIALTLGIWLSYFFHYYLTFQCFEATSHLNLMCGLVTFIVGSIAVIVPTPNGAGPWHFAVKTMLILYGIQANDALFFVLIVHSVQTLLVVLLGIYAWIALAFTGKVKSKE